MAVTQACLSTCYRGIIASGAAVMRSRMDRTMTRRYVCIVLIVSAALSLYADRERIHPGNAVIVALNAQGK